MANSLSKHLQEPMNFPKRTQEIATILCHNQLLDGDTELSRKIVGLLKGAETDWQRAWHIHRLRIWHGSSWTRRRFPEYHVSIIKWRSDFRVDEVVKEVQDLRIDLPQRAMIQQLKDINMVLDHWSLLGHRSASGRSCPTLVWMARQVNRGGGETAVVVMPVIVGER
jgi:hypothetical protein